MASDQSFFQSYFSYDKLNTSLLLPTNIVEKIEMSSLLLFWDHDFIYRFPPLAFYYLVSLAGLDSHSTVKNSGIIVGLFWQTFGVLLLIQFPSKYRAKGKHHANIICKEPPWLAMKVKMCVSNEFWRLLVSICRHKLNDVFIFYLFSKYSRCRNRKKMVCFLMEMVLKASSHQETLWKVQFSRKSMKDDRSI